MGQNQDIVSLLGSQVHHFPTLAISWCFLYSSDFAIFIELFLDLAPNSSCCAWGFILQTDLVDDTSSIYTWGMGGRRANHWPQCQGGSEQTGPDRARTHVYTSLTCQGLLPRLTGLVARDVSHWATLLEAVGVTVGTQQKMTVLLPEWISVKQLRVRVQSPFLPMPGCWQAHSCADPVEGPVVTARLWLQWLCLVSERASRDLSHYVTFHPVLHSILRTLERMGWLSCLVLRLICRLFLAPYTDTSFCIHHYSWKEKLLWLKLRPATVYEHKHTIIFSTRQVN